MSFLKLKGSLCAVLVALAMLVANSQLAMAAVATLVCTNNQRPSDPPFTIDLDQANGTVTYNNNGVLNKIPATFDAKEITYTVGTWTTTISRLTGIITSRTTEDTSVVLHDTCHVATAQF
jgi:hypothetical protein